MPEPQQQQTASIAVPVISALPETKEAQDKGGLEIAIVPAVYTAEKIEKTTTRQANPSVGGILIASIATGGNASGQVYVQQVTEESLRTAPDRLQFTVRINNKLARVFRGQGAVVQFNVAGKLQPFGQTDYKEFVEGIVPPRNEVAFTIYGPPLTSLPERGTIGIFLYDVVTATDVAGNVTEKQNYEWFFGYDSRPVQMAVQRKVTQGFIDVSAFHQLLLREQQEKTTEKMAPR